MARWFRRFGWTLAVLASLGAAALGARRFLQSRLLACRPSALFACADVKRIAQPLCALRLRTACRALDEAYRIEFDAAASLYESCVPSGSEMCVRLAWQTEQWFRGMLDRRRTADAAGRLCDSRHGSACVALGIYYRTGLGVPLDHAREARSLEAAFKLRVQRYPCQWAGACSRAGPGGACREEEAVALQEACFAREREELERGIPHTDYFYVAKAKLSTVKPRRASDDWSSLRDYKDPERDPNSILSGKALVLSIRTFDPGYQVVIDDESFEKLSIEIGSYRIGAPVDVAGPSVRSYFAAGSSSWSPTMGEAYADNAQGSVTILSVDNETGAMKVRVDVTCQRKWSPTSRFAGGPAPDPRVAVFRGEFTFEQKMLDGLPATFGGKAPRLRNFH